MTHYAIHSILNLILDNVPQAIFWKDRNSVYLGCNQTFAKAAGLTHPNDIIGKTDFDLPWTREESELFRRDDSQVMADNTAKTHIIVRRRNLAGEYIWIDSTKIPLTDGVEVFGVLGVYEDITERKINEAKIIRLSDLYAALSQCNQAIVRCSSEEELFPQICRDVVQFGGMEMAWIGLVDEASQMIKSVDAYGAGMEYLDGLEISIKADEKSGQGPTGTCVRTNMPFWCQDFQKDPATAPWHERGARSGWGASASLPLHRKGKVIGTFTLYAGETDAFDEPARNLLVEMAMDIDYALDSFIQQSERKQAEEALRKSEEYARLIQMETVALLHRNQTLMKTAIDGIHILDIHGNIVEANDSFCRMLGYTQEEVITLNVADWDKTWSAEELHERTKRFIHDRASATFETIHCRKDGTLINVEISCTGMEVDKQSYLFCSSRDITERRQAEENLRITASVFGSTHEGIIITDAHNAIIDVNPAFTRITGYSHDEVIGKNPKLLSSNQHDKVFYTKMWKSIQQKRVWHGEIWNRRKSGEIYAEQLSISSVCDGDGKVLRYVGVFSDISHIKEHEAELKRVAHYDALTGIPNRVLLADRMRQAISQTAREQNMMAVCYLDLDGFKPINDTLGHNAGDQVLIEVARRIENTIRGGDTVARLGGDEFVVLQLGLEKGEECVATLERLLAAIAQPITVKNKSNMISASIGVSVYPLDDEDADTLLRHADQAMYIAKQSGKNRFHIYDPALDRRARDEHEFLKSIRHGLEHNQFELYYQPKINLSTKELVGAEALIRWRHPERGLLPPAEFLRLIENTDLDIEIGEWVTATALAQINHWRNTELNIEVSINISGYHL